ncbi:MAG: DUF4215 domain-containing protein [Candidatus Peribacteraceae bacterium]|nr:DUF4215 domain-containing protein [Candidatus Peribacteraceae bacterium]
MSASLFGNRRFLLGAFALSALAFFATVNVRDGGALLGQAAPTYVPAIHAYTKAQCEKGIVIKANDHNQVRCDGDGAFPAFSGPVEKNEQVRFWGYEFTGDEPPFHGKFHISKGELHVNPKYGVINKLGTLQRGKAYYFMTEKDLFFRCGEGISYVQACGNGVLEGAEECDDGNTEDGDGCSANCTVETDDDEYGCGNGIVEEGEECDDGNAVNGDGCADICLLECGDSGLVCAPETLCVENKCVQPDECGNGLKEEGEECDDGNAVNGDGCADICLLECGDSGLVCAPETLCVENKCVQPDECGNGLKEEGEECDDGNTEDGDGCSANCTVETGDDDEESVCGNGIVEEDEECDDGNTEDGDGCDSACRIEDAWSCIGEPSVCTETDSRTFDEHMTNAMNSLSTHTAHLSMSEDGKKLVYVQPTDGGPRPASVYFLDTGKRSVRELITGADKYTSFSQPTISGDGRYVAVRRTSRNRTSGANNQVVFTYQTSVLRIRTEDGTTENIVADTVAPASMLLPTSELNVVISRDGKRVAFVAAMNKRYLDTLGTTGGIPQYKTVQENMLYIWQEASQSPTPVLGISVYEYPDDTSIPALIIQQIPTITALRFEDATGRFLSFVAQKQKMERQQTDGAGWEQKTVLDSMNVYLYDSQPKKLHTVAQLQSGKDPATYGYSRDIRRDIEARHFQDAIDAKIAEILDAEPACGNGKVETGEECDDGNKQNGDGCSGECKQEAIEGWDMQRTFNASVGKTFSLEHPTPAGGQYALLLAGDFDRDKKVAASDLVFLAAKYGSVRGDALYDPEYDLNFDGSVNSLDHQIFNQNSGKQFPQQATVTQGTAAVRLEWTPTANDANATYRFMLVGFIQNRKHTVLLSVSVAPSATQCGDGICDEEEARIICTQCLPGTPCVTECHAVCPADCPSGGPVCSNGVCESEDERLNCPQDCPASPEPECAENGQKVYGSAALGPTTCCNENSGIKPATVAVNGVCISMNDGSQGTCVDGWRQTCGNGTCASGEDHCNCPADCKAPVPEFCTSSAECPQNMFCTTDQGVCNPYPCEPGKPCITVCTGECVPRVDVPQEQCGNGTAEEEEECDDGNTKDGDGCAAACLKEFCGDAIVQETLGEQCDNGAVCSHDTSLSCRTSSDCNRCELIPGTSVKRCGKNPYALICESDADCAAQNTQNTCRYYTELDPSCPETCRQVTAVCGNEKIEGKEQCDDGNTKDDDGCSGTCNIEDGWQCFGEPSECQILIPTLSLPTSAPITLHSINLQGDVLLITYSKDFDTCAILETSRGFMEASKQYLCRRGSKIQVYIPLTSANSAFAQPNSTARLCHSQQTDVCSTSLYINSPPFAHIISIFSKVTSVLASLLFIL